MSERTTSVEGWEIVDAADGRRWLGHVTDRKDGMVQFDKALEAWPYATTAVVVPVAAPMVPAILSGKRAEPQAQLGIQNVLSAPCDFSTPMKLPFIPPWTVYGVVAGCPLSAYPKELQQTFLSIIQDVENKCAQANKDAARVSLHAVEKRH